MPSDARAPANGKPKAITSSPGWTPFPDLKEAIFGGTKDDNSKARSFALSERIKTALNDAWLEWAIPQNVKQHGQDAPIQAAMRADAMLEAGDLGGYAALTSRKLRAMTSLIAKFTF